MAQGIQVETDVSDGLPNFTMIGYLTSKTKEAQDRVRTALRNVDIVIPPKRITVNLAPADIRKDASHFDLPISIGILASLGRVKEERLLDTLFVGELSLNGQVNQVSGIFPIVYHAKEIGCKYCVIPKQNIHETCLVKGIQVIGVRNLKEAMAFLNGKSETEFINQPQYQLKEEEYDCDFQEIKGQEQVKRAVEIAVSGFHNILLMGPPGSGKTMIAKRLPTILPKLTIEDSLEISKIYSIAGLLSNKQPYLGLRPFRSPHHTSSLQALAGGGLVPKPGEITLAHQGVLFLDEMPEFKRETLEILRQPLEERKIHLSRASGTYCFPADFLLIAAMNPCPCGYYPDFNRCNCSAYEINRYLNRISQPLLDRIDLCAEALAVTYEELKEETGAGEDSKTIRGRVERTHLIQRERYKEEKLQFNSQLNASQIKKYCPITKEGESFLKQAFAQMGLTARSYHRIIKVARTIADMEGEDVIQTTHIAEAVCYRNIDKRI